MYVNASQCACLTRYVITTRKLSVKVTLTILPLLATFLPLTMNFDL